MTNYVLVHDAWQGAWAWERVVALLEEAREAREIGAILTPDLPGHGEKTFREIRRITQQHYLEAVVTPVQVQRLSDVVLVGHGFAGTFLMRAAADLGEAVKRVVLIAGQLPPPGKTAFQELSRLLRLMVQPLRPSEKGVMLPRFMYRRLLCTGMDSRTEQEFLSRLVSDPFLPWQTPTQLVDLSPQVQTSYVVLTQDRAVSPATQRRYSRGIPSAEVVDLAAGHEAPITRPAEVADILLRYA